MYEENNYRFLRHYSISDVDILYTEVIIFYPNHKFFFLFSAACRNNNDDSNTNESQLSDDTVDNQKDRS